MKAFLGWCSALFACISLLICIAESSPITATYFMVWAMYLFFVAKEWKG